MPLCLHEDLPHKASQGTAPILNWPCSELGCLEGSFRDEAWFLASSRRFWTRHPGTANKFCAVLLAFGFCASTSVFSQVGPGSLVLFVQSASATTPSYASRVGCHWLRQSAIECPRHRHRREPFAQHPFSAARHKSDIGEDGQLYGLQLENILPMLAPMCAPATSLDMGCH